MSDFELIDAVANKTGEDASEIRRRGFVLACPEDAGSDLDPECVFDLIDLPEAGTVDWDALGFGCREPFFESRRKPLRTLAKTELKKQNARAAA